MLATMERKKEIMISMQAPPFRCRIGCDNM